MEQSPHGKTASPYAGEAVKVDGLFAGALRKRDLSAQRAQRAHAAK